MFSYFLFFAFEAFFIGIATYNAIPTKKVLSQPVGSYLNQAVGITTKAVGMTSMAIGMTIKASGITTKAVGIITKAGTIQTVRVAQKKYIYPN